MGIVVVYDADCGVCQASVAWVRKRDERGSVAFVPNDVAELPEGVSREETDHTLVVLDRGKKFVRGAGTARILRELPRWKWVGSALQVPGIRAVADLAYDRFAAHRHRISAALGLRTCQVPPPSKKP